MFTPPMQDSRPQLQRISDLHSGYLALRFPLLFPYREDGWHPEIALAQNVAAGNAQRRDSEFHDGEERTWFSMS
jgi:hypothetical protein